MIGPIAESEFAALARSGKLALTTKVSSPTRTPNVWHELRQVPGLLKLLQEGESERKQVKEAAAAEQARRKLAAGAAKQARADEQETRIAKRGQSAILHCHDVALIRSVEQRVRAILTSQDDSARGAGKPRQHAPMGLSPARTTDFTARLLGRFEFQDYLVRSSHAHFRIWGDF
jgi:hypothetical protein